MAYPDEVLVDGEQLLVHQRPHPKMLLAPVVVFVLVCAVAGYLAAVVSRESWRGVGWALGAAIAAMLVARFTVAPFVRWLCTHFVVTDRRVLVRSGALSRVRLEIPMSRIDSVHSHQGVVERMFGCGTLTIESASEEPVEFRDIPRVEQVYLTLREASG